MVALIYIGAVLGSLLALGIVVFGPHRPAPTPPPVAPVPTDPVASVAGSPAAEVRLILQAAVRLAEQLVPAA